MQNDPPSITAIRYLQDTKMANGFLQMDDIWGEGAREVARPISVRGFFPLFHAR